MKLRAALPQLLLLSLTSLFSLSCKSGDPIAEDVPPPAKATAQATQGAAVRAPSTAARPAPAPAAEKPGKHVDFDPKIAWKSWDDAQSAAQASGKPIMLVLYADWCPHCRELSPVFSDAEVQKLSEGLVMVHQNSDEDPPWLKRYASVGSYVPRILFLAPDGALKADLNSGNGRFPYFYTPQGIDVLKSSMRRASGG